MQKEPLKPKHIEITPWAFGLGAGIARIFLKENPEISNEIEQLVRDNSSIKAEINANALSDEDEESSAE